MPMSNVLFGLQHLPCSSVYCVWYKQTVICLINAKINFGLVFTLKVTNQRRVIHIYQTLEQLFPKWSMLVEVSKYVHKVCTKYGSMYIRTRERQMPKAVIPTNNRNVPALSEKPQSYPKSPNNFSSVLTPFETLSSCLLWPHFPVSS